MRSILQSLSRFLLPPLLAAATAAAAAAPTYRAEVIAAPVPLGGGAWLWYSAVATNNHGTNLLAMFQTGSGGLSYVVHDKHGQYLRTVGGFSRYGGSLLYRINNWGDIVGDQTHDNFIFAGTVIKDQGFGASIHGFPEGTFGGYFSDAYANGLSDNGYVAGQAEGELDGRLRAYVWHDGVMQEIGTFGGATSTAVAVSNRGVAVGAADLADGSAHAFVFRHGVLHDLGTLGGANSRATDINERGQIVGAAQQADGVERAFFVARKKMSALPTPEGASANARSVNRVGHVVGTYVQEGVGHSFLYDGVAVHRIQDLLTDADKSVWSIAYVASINDKGWILVDADRGTDEHSSVLLLKPVR